MLWLTAMQKNSKGKMRFIRGNHIMNKKYVKTGIVLVSALLLFSGCTQSAGNLSKESQMVEGLKELGTIRVISREDGSGTRSTFAELAGFQGEGEVGNNHSDLTTENAVIVNNADEVIRDVAADISAIGYVSKAAISGNGGVKSLKVEGKTPEQGEKYPLNRDFYLGGENWSIKIYYGTKK